MMRLRAGPMLAAMALAGLALLQAATCSRGTRIAPRGRRRHRSADRRLHRARARRGEAGSGPARHSADEHAGRPRHLDAPDHQRDPGFACAGRHLCRAERSACGQCRHLYRLRQRNRGDGAGHQYWRSHAGSVRRQSGAAVGSEPGKRTKTTGGKQANPRTRRRARLSTTPSPIFAALPRSMTAMPTGPSRRCVPPQACRPPKRSRFTSSI